MLALFPALQWNFDILGGISQTNQILSLAPSLLLSPAPEPDWDGPDLIN